VVINISILEEVSSVGACYLLCYADIALSVLNEIQCGTGIEWGDLIDQHTSAVHSL